MSSTASVGGDYSAYATHTSRGVERFISRADQNGDGQVSLSEFGSLMQNLPGGSATSSASATSTAAATVDPSTAATTPSTASSAPSALFGQIDTNGDGELSADELSTYKQQQATAARTALLNLQEVFGGGSGGGADGASRTHRGHHHHAAQATTDGGVSTGQGDATAQGTAASSSSSSTDPVSAFFSAVDTNGDGSVSRAELTSFVTQLLGRLGSSSQAGTSTTTGTTA